MYDQNFFDLPQKSLAFFGFLQKSSEILVNSRKMFRNVRVVFWRMFGNLGKKSAENCQNVVISMFI